MSEGPLTRATISGPGTTTAAAPQAGRPAVLSLAIKEKAALYAAYMPFLKNGGIFVPTSRKYELGDEVYLILALMDDPAKVPVAGKVVWISPAGGTRQAGIGLQFPEDESGIAVKKRIEDLLGSALKSGRPTHTI
ncbi:MAG: PilZ domain-containing protein [Burkholderiales bacterium]|jgi:type IV pilus assembly protein PilZ|nr:PilZ domain-containing protein [Burkholderiales bacterium]